MLDLGIDLLLDLECQRRFLILQLLALLAQLQLFVSQRRHLTISLRELPLK